jgi:hypothetical protein
MAYNKKRAESFARKSSPELVKFYKSGSLSAAAAFYQLKKRGDLHLLAE